MRRMDRENWLPRRKKFFRREHCRRRHFCYRHSLFLRVAAWAGSFGGFCESRGTRVGQRRLCLPSLVQPGFFLLGYSAWIRLTVVQLNFNLAWLIPTHLYAGIWLFLSRNRPPLLRRYFWFAAIGGSAFVGFSFLFPQKFHPAVYPLVAIIIWRSVLELDLWSYGRVPKCSSEPGR